MLKKILILSLCIALSVGCIGCRKSDNNLSSTLSDLPQTESTVTDVSSDNNTSSNTNTSSNQSTTSNSSSEEAIDLEEKYGFSSLKSVEYECVKDIPTGDAVYEVTAIMTNKNNSISYMGVISCSDKDIVIDGLKITIPYEYRQKHNSVKLTASHRFANVSCDFTINFEKWELTFEDNFDGTTLNTDVWNVWDEKRDNGYAYSKNNSFLDGKGNLVNRMSVLKEPDPATGQTKLTSVIETNDKFETTYGYFETRLIPHRAEGLMGAFWLTCGDMNDKNAPKDNTAVNGCEIDIVETFFHRKTPSQTIHWDGYGWYQDENGEWQTVTKSKHLPIPAMEEIFDGNYHTFALFWTPEEYIFLVDGEVTNRTSEMGICNQPGYILISSHFNTEAGELPIGPGEHTDMIVDYVKVYTNKDY